jgi:hypothetical protein
LAAIQGHGFCFCFSGAGKRQEQIMAHPLPASGSSTLRASRHPILGGILGALVGGFAAGPLVWLLLCGIGAVTSLRVDEAEGHRGGESTASMLAILAVWGSLLVAVVTGFCGALGGGIGGASNIAVPKAVGLGAATGAVVTGVFALLWLGSGGEIGTALLASLVLTVLGAGGGAIRAAVGGGFRKLLGSGR